MRFLGVLAASARANISVFTFIGLMLVFRSAFADWMVVPSGSMNPTIVEGDRVLVNKHVFGYRVPFTTVRLTAGEDPRRGDIVVFASPKDGIVLIKRVIGLPGDSIEMREDRLLVNHRPVSYLTAAASRDADMLAVSRAEPHQIATELLPGKPHAVMVLPERSAMRDFGPLVVPAGHYFMMGDNRDNSADSRYIGPVGRNLIVGRAEDVVISLDADRHELPRGDRFFKSLDDEATSVHRP
jgi:signal peptidase I